jgi:hypothetical protein
LPSSLVASPDSLAPSPASPHCHCRGAPVPSWLAALRAQVPGATVWYGPDTYMGANLAQLFAELAASGSDEDVRALHPGHSVESIRCGEGSEGVGGRGEAELWRGWGVAS